MAKLIERANVEASLKKKIDDIVEVERGILKKQGYDGPSRLAVVAKLIEEGVRTWEQKRNT